MDKGVASTDLFRLVEDILKQNNIRFEIFTDIETDPSDITVEKAYEIYQENKPSALVALGGGSTIDVAKAVAILATNGGGIHDYEEIDLFTNPLRQRVFFEKNTEREALRTKSVSQP